MAFKIQCTCGQRYDAEDKDSDRVFSCSKCGAEIRVRNFLPPKVKPPPERYGSLRAVIGICKGFAFLMFFGAALSAAALASEGHTSQAVAYGVSGLLSAIGLSGLGQILNVLIDIEANTRSTADAVNRVALAHETRTPAA